MAEIEIARLTLRFGGLVALDDISFAVEPGELFALIGPNGAGKTSVLNCISGLYCGSGSIRFRGQDLGGRSPHAIARLGIAMIWIEHDMQMVTDLADRIHVLDYGRTLAVGRPADVLKHPDVIRAYLGGGAMAEERVTAADVTDGQP